MHWTLPVGLDPELQQACSPLEQHQMIGKDCGCFGRKQEQESDASLAPNAGPGGAPANSQLEDERLVYQLVPFSKVLRVGAGRWEAVLSLAIS